MISEQRWVISLADYNVSDYDPSSDTASVPASETTEPTETAQPKDDPQPDTLKPATTEDNSVSVRKPSTKKIRKKMTNSEILSELGK